MFIELTDTKGVKFLLNKVVIERVKECKYKGHDNSFWNSIVIYSSREVNGSDRVRESYEEIKKMLET